MAKMREPEGQRGTKQTETNGHREWKTPRGGDMREVARDSTGQVLERYSEALKKLKKS